MVEIKAKAIKDGQTPVKQSPQKNAIKKEVVKKEKISTVKTEGLNRAFSDQVTEPMDFVNIILDETIDLSASDILFEPSNEDLRIRARIDGVLYELGRTDLDAYAYISSRIKVLSSLDPTEKRRIQEGQFSINRDGKIVNLRVEIAQTIHGELIVIRIHEKGTIVMELSELGFGNEAYRTYHSMLEQKSGLILVCGPTGCGKTTTLYSTISKLNENLNYNIMTIEDPVEFQLEGVNQMQTQKSTDFTFADGLRTILRLSPDIVLVGEIRDKETAEIAIESGLTGQLVLSTIHAEDSVGTLLRMLDLGIENYLLNSALLGVVAQRLVRKICPACKVAYQPTPAEMDFFVGVMGRPPKKLYRGKGCPECNGISYRGRGGIYEVLKIDDVIRDLIREKTNEVVFRDKLLGTGFKTLLRSGLTKCEEGFTTVDEVLRNSLRID